MKHVIYAPDEGDSPVVTVFGLTFKAGSPTEVADEVFAKLSGNPTFKAARAAKADAPEDGKQTKVDGRSKAARAAKADDEAAARAKAHQADLEDAKAEEAEEKAGR